MNDGEGPGIGIINAALLGAERMLQHLVFDTVIGQRPRRVEAERPKVAGQNLHRRDTASLNGFHEFRPGCEREILPAPKPEPLRVGEVVDGRRARGRDIDYAGIRQLVLQAQTRPALLRGHGIAPLTIAAGGIRHCMAFVEEDHPVEIRPEPVDDLVDAGFLGTPFFRAQRRIGGEENTLGQRDVAALCETRQRRHQQALLPERRPIALRIYQQLVAFRDPERLAAALAPVVEQDPSRLAALARAGAITEEETPAEADSISGVLRCCGYHVSGLIDGPRPRETRAMRLPRVDDGLELRVGQQAVAQDGRGQLGAVRGFRRCDRGHGRRLHKLGRVRCGVWDVDSLQTEGLVDLVGQPCGVFFLGGVAESVVQFVGLNRCFRCRRFGPRGRARSADGFACGGGRTSQEEGTVAQTRIYGLLHLETRRNLCSDPGH